MRRKSVSICETKGIKQSNQEAKELTLGWWIPYRSSSDRSKAAVGESAVNADGGGLLSGEFWAHSNIWACCGSL